MPESVWPELHRVWTARSLLCTGIYTHMHTLWTLPYLTFEVGRLSTCPTLRLYQLSPVCSPECNQRSH